MTAYALLEHVEWDGDFLNWVFGILAGAAFVAAGFVVGRRGPFVVLAAAGVAIFVALDLLYWQTGLNPGGVYCGEPKCDPGPIPLTYLTPFVLAALLLAVGGTAIRRGRDSRRLRSNP